MCQHVLPANNIQPYHSVEKGPAKVYESPIPIAWFYSCSASLRASSPAALFSFHCIWLTTLKYSLKYTQLYRSLSKNHSYKAMSVCDEGSSFVTCGHLILICSKPSLTDIPVNQSLCICLIGWHERWSRVLW